MPYIYDSRDYHAYFGMCLATWLVDRFFTCSQTISCLGMSKIILCMADGNYGREYIPKKCSNF